MANPGRGWYYHLSTPTSNYQPLDYDKLLQLRNNDNYTLIFRFFVLNSFKSNPIDDTTLQKIANDFDLARRAFFKLIIRFAYTITFNDPPPRGDAPKSIILQHIGQLAPILINNADIILAVQHGFIGTWGEGYFTDYFGDKGDISPQQWQDREEVYNALINGVPNCTMIQVRTWQFKERLTGTNLPVSMEDAYMCGNDSLAQEARTGIHDDCFLASDTDYGTWQDSAVDKPRMSNHSTFTIFGGETCNPNNNRTHCPIALQELSFFHMTYLNNLYHPDVLNRWREQGCYDRISRSLGYRLVLVSSAFPSHARAGSEMNFKIVLRNDGFAAPVTDMVLKLVVWEQEGNRSCSLDISGSNTDPRFWFGNGIRHSITGNVLIPTNMSNGTWNIFLAIADAAPHLKEIPQYNILAVNQESSMQVLGLNNLSRSIIVIPVTVVTELGMETSDSEFVTEVQIINSAVSNNSFFTVPCATFLLSYILVLTVVVSCKSY